LPDLGERLAIARLQALCDEIKEIYEHGARITICSDGLVFSDLVKVREEDVHRYRDALAALIQSLGASAISQLHLDDVYGREDYAVMREELLISYGTSLRELRRRVCEGDVDARSMFNGIHRFVLEDYCALSPHVSRTQLRAASKIAAYRVIQRSNAWSRLVEATLPHALRLSIHPQRAHSRKIGVTLVPCSDAWGTPWHNVVVLCAGQPLLMKRRQAEELGARLIVVADVPSHFELAESAPSVRPPVVRKAMS
jgi:pyoverdine/dityrosine biosynthesis protein Dit1